MTRILLVEDNRGDARLFEELVSEVPGRPFGVTSVGTLADAIAAVPGHDIVFLDLSLPDAHGTDTVTAMIAAARAIPIIVLTGTDDDRTALDAMKAGAQDYLTKAEITPSLISRTVRYAVERRRAQEALHQIASLDRAVVRARFMSSVTAAINSSLEIEAVLPDVARLLVPTLGDVCVIDLNRDGRIQRMAHATSDPATEEAVRVAYDYPPGPRNPRSPVLRAIETRTTIVLADFEPAMFAADPQARDGLERLGARSMMVTPLVARDRVVGAITYVMARSGRRYDGDELRLLAEEVGQRIALGIDNATLYSTAQRAIRGRDELLAVVSHDLRNPLGVVALALAMIERDPSSLAGTLARAKRGVDRMQRLIDDLLDIARIDAGTLVVDPRPVDVRVLVDEAYEAHRALAQDKGIALVRGELIGCAVLADRHRIGQALGNLIGNALKFTPAGGTIRIAAAERAGTAVISVADSGIGIPREHLDKIFERFYQPERRRDGVGLGLAIVKGIVDAHGGSIEVESAPDHGTTFRIALPTAASGAIALAQ
ncbi:MAG TPA: hybrid sensor histidine kinase/response regulator [Kofleriaceae bacterium]|nr:hybrid sensor histidine kinase/response regulator [Kofleriaceae bacterium]